MVDYLNLFDCVPFVNIRLDRFVELIYHNCLLDAMQMSVHQSVCLSVCLSLSV